MRGTAAAALARAAAEPAGRIDAVLSGGDPDPDLLRRLAPVLGLHTADLFTFACRPMPDDLLPCRLDGPWNVGHLVDHRLISEGSTERIAELGEFVAALPDRRTPRTSSWPGDDKGDAAGAVLLRLIGNRNIKVSAAVMMDVGGGPYVSTPTYRMVLGGALPMTADYFNAFARVLGIGLGDLAALLGLDPVEELAYPWPDEPPAGLAELAWAARRLCDEQLHQAMDFADRLARR